MTHLVPTIPSDNHGSFSGLGDDDHAQYLLLAGRAGGQVAIGGTAAADHLRLQANGVNTGTGRVFLDSPMRISDVSAADQYVVTYDPTVPGQGAYVGGFIATEQDLTYDNSFFVWAMLADTGTFRAGANPTFAAWTWANALPTITNAGNFNLVQAIVLNCGVVHERATSGTSTVTQTIGLNFAAQTRADGAGAVMTRTTGMTAVQVAPTYSTDPGSTVNMGSIRGLYCLAPAVALFQTGTGTNNLTEYIGVDFTNITFATSGEKNVIRSAMTDAADRLFLNNLGGARSDLGGGALFDCGTLQILADNLGLQLGAGVDVTINWNGSALEYDPLVGDDLRWTFGASFHTLQSAGFGTASEVRFGFDRFAFGQTGAVGNQVGIFVAPARTVTIAGEWSDFLLTQAGNLTVNANVSVFGWTINAPSMTAGTGTVTDAAALNIGGNVNLGTNRYGVRILSNPTGGTINEALSVVNGRAHFNRARVGSALDATAAGSFVAGNDGAARMLYTTASTALTFYDASGNAVAQARASGRDFQCFQSTGNFLAARIRANTAGTGGALEALRASGGQIAVSLDTTGATAIVGLASDAEIRWASGTTLPGTKDTGIRRSAAGVVQITNGAAAVASLHCDDAEIDGDLNHDGTNAGFYGTAPVAQAAAVTNLTDSTGGTANDTLAAVAGSGADAVINDNFADLAAKVNALLDMLSATNGVGIHAQ